LTQLLDYKHELVLLLVNTLLSDLKSDNFVVVASALVVTSKLIGPDLVNAGEVCAALLRYFSPVSCIHEPCVRLALAVFRSLRVSGLGLPL
jgi:hypothetical protein